MITTKNDSHMKKLLLILAIAGMIAADLILTGQNVLAGLALVGIALLFCLAAGESRLGQRTPTDRTKCYNSTINSPVVP